VASSVVFSERQKYFPGEIRRRAACHLQDSERHPFEYLWKCPKHRRVEIASKHLPSQNGTFRKCNVIVRQRDAASKHVGKLCV
jgi:hypothetical protein